MSKAVTGNNVSGAWLKGLDCLAGAGGELVNLCVTISNPVREDPAVRSALDEFIAPHRANPGGQRTELVSTVANTVFPSALYLPRLGEDARCHLYKMAEMGRRVSRRRNRSGTYFDRMISWPAQSGPFNQLERCIERLHGAGRKGHRNGNEYEIGLSIPDLDGDFRTAIPIYAAGTDNRTRGFPCLSHISVTLHEGKVHLAAVYRNHQFVRRAYGNYLGLGRLLSFLASESGWEIGEITCLSSHATAEFGSGRGFGEKNIRSLLDRGLRSLNGESASDHV